MLTFLKLLTLIVVLICQNSLAGGFSVGGGGNVVQCAGQPWTYSFDYVLTKGMWGPQVKTVPITTISKSLQRIGNLLEQKIPELSASFVEFSQQIKNEDTSKRYVWKPARGTLYSIEEDLPNLPRWCLLNGGAIINQVIVRTQSGDERKSKEQVFLDYDAGIISILERNNLSQLSFLLVHEWLWNYTADPVTNRQLNYFLHSDLFTNMTAQQAQVQIRKLGIYDVKVPGSSN